MCNTKEVLQCKSVVANRNRKNRTAVILMLTFCSVDVVVN